MAQLFVRWRAPLLGGIAIWLLSFPLLVSHPVSVKPVAAHAAKTVEIKVNDHGLFQQLAHEEQLALALSKTVAAAAVPPPVAAAPVAIAPRPAPAAAPPASPAVHANNIVIPRLGLNQPVGWYTDCLGRAAVPRWGTWRWSCAGANNIYVMAHNPGIFTPILGLHAGDIIKYGDPSGRVHTYRVSYTTIVSNTQMWPLGATSSSAITLQTCWTWDGSRDFIVRALEI
jgi:sortase (surface protein transpeptidase)